MSDVALPGLVDFDPLEIAGLSEVEKRALVAKLRIELASRVALRHVTWIVTHQCHLDCAYCYVQTERALRASDSLLTRGQVCDIFGQCAALGATTASFRGGEPFLRRDLIDILAVVDTLGLVSDVTTKIALSPIQIAQLANFRHLALGVSLDTIYEDTGDALLRRRGQTRALMRTIARLVRAELTLTVEATVTTRTVRGLDDLIGFCRDAGVRRLHLRQVAPHGVRPVRELMLTEDDAATVQALAESANDDSLQIDWTPAFSSSRECGEGLMALTFLPDGTVTKCTASLARHPEMAYGDLRSERVAEVVTGERLASLFKRVMASGDALSPHDRPRAGTPPCSQLVQLTTGSLFRVKADDR